MFVSSTQSIPDTSVVPRHVAIVMDGNGRWAKKRFLPRVAGHRRGVEAVRAVVRACAERGVEYLTLFAFSSENWRRPEEEVSVLKQLFRMALEQEVEKLHEAGIRLRVIGHVAPFGETIEGLVRRAETRTAGNRKLTLTIAANYGGRWDLLQAINAMTRAAPSRAGGYSEAELTPHLAMSYAPEPDLFIRTGGEQRISNFLIWQLAYAELYFTELLWPDFDSAALDAAFAWYLQRERRFGRTSEQLARSPAPGDAPEEAAVAVPAAGSPRRARGPA
jgi:undecaprenyl diphosphate synthase